MTFNSKFHTLKPGHRVFGNSISYVEQYLERKGPKKNEFVLHVALKNDSDIILHSPNQHTQMNTFRNAGLVEIIPNLLVNPENVAQIISGDKHVRLLLDGKEGQIDITEGKTDRKGMGIYTVGGQEFINAKLAADSMEGDVPTNITNIQQTLEDMVGTFAQIQTALDATNTGLTTGTLLVDRIEVG